MIHLVSASQAFDFYEYCNAWLRKFPATTGVNFANVLLCLVAECGLPTPKLCLLKKFSGAGRSNVLSL
jgi:hypothetical protein